jgi:putative endonuclease
VTGSEKQLPRLKKRNLSSKQRSQHNFSLGQHGEQQAANFLTQQGYQIEACNIRYKTHEIDIVALDKKHHELVFVEVKTRAGSEFGTPAEAVDQRKLRSLQQAARVYRQQMRLNKVDYRFDIVTVLPGRIEHYQNVTWI